ncbi:unnamed protein product [Polarella glacialis]|uniref:Uncharacterized protein n=1 Tax=Polarella glacialis TaxID=89957 RepID=A0A813HN98_POLGL|nr:unnamed protein product [Polarella glacialis]CAE8638898.1 unnamed protein product [Polarella glacialis]CAE8721440.1 unnamed protein product [Polarella glacialis]
MTAIKSARCAGCKRACCCPCLPWTACPLFAVTGAIVFLLLGIWAVHLRSRFTPVYKDITCRLGEPKLQSISGGILSSPLDLSLEVTVECENPNQYALTVTETKLGKVYMGADRTEVGSLMQIPSAELPAQGTGSISATTSISLSGPLFGTLIGALFGDVPIWLELNMDIGVDVNFLLGRWQTSLPFNKDCGMNLLGVPQLLLNPQGAKLGPMACADSFDALVIPSGSSGSSQGDSLSFDAAKIAPEQVDQATAVKDASLTSAIAVSFSLCGLLLLLGSLCVIRHFADDDYADDVEMKQFEPPAAVTIGANASTSYEV